MEYANRSEQKEKADKQEIVYRHFTYREADGTEIYVSVQVSEKCETYNGIDI